MDSDSDFQNDSTTPLTYLDKQVKSIIHDENILPTSSHTSDSTRQQQENNDSKQQQTEIYKYTDKGPFYVIVEKQELDPIQLGIKLKRIPNHQIISIQRLGNNKARVHLNSYSAANKLITQTNFIGIPEYKVYLPLSFVTTTGVIRNIPSYYSEIEILQNITSTIPILGIERLTSWDFENKIAKPSTSIKISFRSTNIPDKVYIAFNPVKVELFIQRPLFCRKCLTYGHPVKYCKSKIPRCGNCSEPEHDTQNMCQTKCAFCTKIPSLPNNHRTSSNTCPKYKQQYEIKKTMIVKRISFKEAEAEVLKLNPPAVKPTDLQTFLYSHILSNPIPTSSKTQPLHLQPKKLRSDSETQTQTDLPNVSSQPQNSKENKENNNHLKFILSLINLFQSSYENGSNSELILNQISHSLNEYADANKLYTLTETDPPNESGTFDCFGIRSAKQ